MPEGQFSGTRSAYVYTSDADDLYILQVDDTLASLAGVDLDDYTGQANAKPAPKRFSPRVTYWESTDGSKRKKLICGKPDSTLYGQEKSSNLTIDGITGFTTGRRGEKLTYIKQKAVADG